MQRQDQTAVTVELSGLTTLSTITDAYNKLLSALTQNPGGRVIVDVGKTSDVDLSFVQLLLSARRSAAQTNTDLTLSSPASDALLATLTRGGFLSPPADHFWLGKKED